MENMPICLNCRLKITLNFKEGVYNYMSRVGIIGENSPNFIELLIDIWNNGDCAVMIDWRIPIQTAVQMLIEANANKCYVESKFYQDVYCVSKEVEMVSYDKTTNSADLLSKNIQNKYCANYSTSEAVVIYSSGTTGKSKGVILSHKAINTNADGIIEHMKLSEKDCIYVARSMSHASTLTGELLVALKSNINLVVAPTVVSPRFVFTNLNKFDVSILHINPALLSLYTNDLMHTPRKFPKLRMLYVSGSILRDRVRDFALYAFNDTPIYNAYGLTEAGPRVTTQKNCTRNSVGVAMKDVKIQIVGSKGELKVMGEKGIIYIKTPSLFNGYITETPKPMSPCGEWLISGDIGYIDAYAELQIVDRADSMIIVNSHNVYPREVEKVIDSHPDVKESVVFPNPSEPDSGLICEFVGVDNTVDYHLPFDIRRWCFERLPSYEIPLKIIQVDKLRIHAKGGLVRN